MHKIKDKLMEELYKVEDKLKKSSGGQLSGGDLEYIHKLTDTVKNIDKICVLEESDGYSEDTDYMGEGRIYGSSYARGRNARRDSMGRYSHNGDMSYARNGRGGYSRNDATEMLIEKAEDILRSGELRPTQEKAVRNFINALEE